MTYKSLWSEGPNELQCPVKIFALEFYSFLVSALKEQKSSPSISDGRDASECIKFGKGLKYNSMKYPINSCPKFYIFGNNLS